MRDEYDITVDERGRITIPKEVREQIKVRKFRLKVEQGKIILKPVSSNPEKYYGIFRKDIGNIDIDKVFEETLLKE
ncbi:AbrB/MazE/SpoVT family DNA-binding domain-containing protein [Acidianus sp. HS-5]|uniref:AbrB/MazE/SpoVT family DNA-binding domain-containing protein n=1 Tax=Acidianus sp. HS-5 TaxID=2886040 RepID=UPI001F30AADA|nr:AbrB/MazE/SpoVT family DNA-binding domain-containing protein [Acidianus sp. HS-5]BDC17331.1 hypothetical protein HS5_02210 [Acidianus sp. HS-5]